MQNNKFLDDITRVMTSAVNTVFDSQKHFSDSLKHHAERTMSGFGFVTREEFDVAKEMAVKARRENEALKARLAELEKKISAKPVAVKTASAPKKSPAKAAQRAGRKQR